jgi:hypothetical protein
MVNIRKELTSIYDFLKKAKLQETYKCQTAVVSVDDKLKSNTT